MTGAKRIGQGIVPASLLEQGPPKRTAWTISRCIAEYIRHNAVPMSDLKLVDTIRPVLGILDRTKNGDNRQVPLSTVVGALLGEHIEKNR